MKGDLFDVTSLVQDLDAAARRRLWLVGQLIGHPNVSELESALRAAAKLETFITDGYNSHKIAPDGSDPTVIARPGPIIDRVVHAADAQVSAPSATPRERQNVPGIGGKCRVARRPLLDRETRARFIREASRDPDNRHLAQLFGLTVRQAHAIRVALSKFISDTGPRQAATILERKKNGAKCKDRGVQLDRETELKMQEDFLRAKPPAAPTIEDVVRYLRQAGDVVVPNSENYAVNYNLTLTTEQLIERANMKRRGRNQLPFPRADMVLSR